MKYDAKTQRHLLVLFLTMSGIPVEKELAILVESLGGLMVTIAFKSRQLDQ